MQEQEKLLSVSDIGNRELVVPSGILVPVKDEGLLEYEEDNALFAVLGMISSRLNPVLWCWLNMTQNMISA